MIDTNQLSALVSAFRVETEKESISPETVGKLLQDILDLLTTASSDTERQILDDWKTLLSQYTVVYDVAHATGMADMQTMFLTLKGRSLRNGATFTSSVPLYGATDLKAGVMTASHVQTLMALQTAMPQLRSAITSLQTLIGQHDQQLFIIQAAGYVVTGISQGNGHSSKINLSVTKHDVRTGEDFVFGAGCTINGATAQQAGAMTAEHVQSLTNAKSNITTLQSQMCNVRGAGAVVSGAQVFLIDSNRVGIQLFGFDLATGRAIDLDPFHIPTASTTGAGVMTAAQCRLLGALRDAVLGGSTTSFLPLYSVAIEIKKAYNELFLRDIKFLTEQGYIPYLFRFSRKRNRLTKDTGEKWHGPVRKGWNVLGDSHTLNIGTDGRVKIDIKAMRHPTIDTEGIEPYRPDAQFFVKEEVDNSGRYYVA